MNVVPPPVELPLAIATAFDPSTKRIPAPPLLPRRDESAAELGLAALADVRASFMRPA